MDMATATTTILAVIRHRTAHTGRIALVAAATRHTTFRAVRAGDPHASLSRSGAPLGSSGHSTSRSEAGSCSLNAIANVAPLPRSLALLSACLGWNQISIGLPFGRAARWRRSFSKPPRSPRPWRVARTRREAELLEDLAHPCARGKRPRSARPRAYTIARQTGGVMMHVAMIPTSVPISIERSSARGA